MGQQRQLRSKVGFAVDTAEVGIRVRMMRFLTMHRYASTLTLTFSSLDPCIMI